MRCHQSIQINCVHLKHKLSLIQFLEYFMNCASKYRSLPLVLASALALGGAGFCGKSHAAGSSTANLAVTATVLDSCLIVTTPVVFGNYSPGGPSNLLGTGTITATCTIGTTGTITLGQGTNPTASSTDAAPQRQMASGSSRLGYFLYQDASRTTIWGNTPATGESQSGTGLPGLPLTVYGSVTAGQNVPAGAYLDTVV